MYTFYLSKLMRLHFYILALFIIVMLPAKAQENHYTFNNINEKNGLVENIIFCLLKDKEGILWIGTQNGLSRYDGAHFYNYKRKKDGSSLPHNAIESLCKDKNENIWGGTDNGIFCYTPSLNTFKTFAAPSNCKDNVIHNICSDKQGNIYATTTYEFIKFNQPKNQFEKVIQFTPKSDSLGLYRVGKNRMLYDTINHGFWFATSGGLQFYDIDKHTLLDSRSKPSHPLFITRRTTALTMSPDGNIWFSDNTSHEVIAFNPLGMSITRKVILKGKTEDGNIATMLVDNHHRLWISNWIFNLLCIDLDKQDKIEQLYSKDEDKSSIGGQFLWDAFEDENGSIWFGTLNGLSICNADKQLYKACHLPDKIPELKSTPLYAIKENAKDKSWWFSTGDCKVIQYFPSTFKYKVYYPQQFIANQKGERPVDIYSIHFVNDDVLITSSRGAWQLKKGSLNFAPSTLLPKKFNDFTITNFIATESVYYFSDGAKMLTLNKQTQQTKLITYDSTLQKQKPYIGFSQLLNTPNQQLFWTCGKNYISTENSTGKPQLINMIKDSIVEAGGYFHAADMDKEGNVWILNKGVGLYRYNPHLKEIKYWNDLDGLVNNHLHAVLADDSNYVWCTYYNKVSVFNKKENSFINFSIPFGENKSVYFNNLTKRSDGVIMGNVYNDLIEFYSENLKISPIKKSPVFSAISISGQDFFPSNDANLNLKPEENSVRIKYGMLIDEATYPHTFEYFLEGSDHIWVQASASNEANYNNLASGDYTFRVVAKGKNKAWRSEEKILRIHIQTPFYKSKWFLAMLLLLFASGIFFLYRYRLLQKEKLFALDSKAQLLEKEKTMVMYESLKQQLNPHFLFNSLTSLSGLIETDQAMAGEFLEQMSGIYRYILKHGNSETVALKEELNFAQLYIRLQQTRFSNGLQVIINIPTEYLYYKIAPVTIQNLLENAIKHNIIDSDTPLIINIFIEDDYLIVKNNLQKKSNVDTSNKKGLVQFISLYQYLNSKPVVVEENAAYFKVKIPLI